MNQIPCRTVEQLEQFLQQQYAAQPIEPVDYLLYNTRHQMLQLFYPQQVEELVESTGFSPDADEITAAIFDAAVENLDAELCSQYVQYRFAQTAPAGTPAVFYVTIEKNTGFVLPQYEWGSDDIAEVLDEDYRYFNCILRDILLYQGASEEDIAQNSPRYQRYCIAKEFWDSVC